MGKHRAKGGGGGVTQLRQIAERRVSEVERQLRAVLERAGALTVEHLKGYTGETVPAPHDSPDRRRFRQARLEQARVRLAAARGRGDEQAVLKAQAQVTALEAAIAAHEKKDRPAHPGGWGDRTNRLREGYGFEVVAVTDGFALSIINAARHGHLVEALDGMFVVRGVTDRDGPVQRAIRQAMSEQRVTWTT